MENNLPIDESRLSYRYNEFGELEVIDVWTGELISTEMRQPALKYELAKGSMVCDLIRTGKTLLEIAAMNHMPTLQTLYKWRAAHPDFKERLLNARKDYADNLVEKAVMQAHSALTTNPTKDELAQMQFAVATFMKVAEKYDPDVFGNRTKLTGDVNAPIQFVISTGIVRGDNEEKLAEDFVSAEFAPVGVPTSQEQEQTDVARIEDMPELSEKSE